MSRRVLPSIDEHPLAIGLRLLREQNALTQSQIAQASRVSAETIKRAEGGITLANDLTICAYARALNITPTVALMRAAELAADHARAQATPNEETDPC